MLVYGLGKKHQIGTICGVPCAQCVGDDSEVGELKMVGTGEMGRIPAQPLFIVREASHEEYVTSCRQNDNGANKGRTAKPEEGLFYYVVTTD